MNTQAANRNLGHRAGVIAMLLMILPGRSRRTAMKSIALIAGLLAATSYSAGQEVVQEIAPAELHESGALPAGVRFARADDLSSSDYLVIEHTRTDAQPIRIATIATPGVTLPVYAIEGQVRYEDVAGDAYLMTLNYFADGGPFFTKGIAPGGPARKISGTSDWRPFVLPFYCISSSGGDSGNRPSKIELFLVLPGSGKVYLRNMRLTQFALGANPLASAAQRRTDADPLASSGRSARAARGKRVVLDNGVTLLLLPIPEAKQVGIEAIYRVGFLHEPKDMTQAAHLLEHLVCNAATSGYGPNESMAALNQVGMANAETLPDWTHYDYLLPTEKLELALTIEAERLTSLRIDSEIIKVEAPRCYMETDFVERNPKSGMIKHAFMAFAQSWRHGSTKARVRGGLEEFAIDELVRFHRATYRPDNLTLIVVGGFDRKKTIDLARKHLGQIQAPEVERPGAIDWSKIPKRTTVRWDAKVRAVCIAFAPPRGRVDRVALSLWGNLLLQRLASDGAVAAITDSVSCSNQMWNVGELPFYVYATASEGESLEDVERLLNERIESFVKEKPSAMVVQQIRGMANQLARQTDMLNWDYVKNSAAMVARQRGVDETLAQGMVLGQAALNWGVAHFLLGSSPQRIAKSVAALTADRLHRMVRRHLAPKKRFVTLLLPAEGAATSP